MASLTIPPRSAVIQTLAFLGLIAAGLFGSAGRFSIAGFWLYLVIVAATSGVALCVVDPDLSRERARPGGQRLGAKYVLVILLPFAHLGNCRVGPGTVPLVRYGDNIPAVRRLGSLRCGMGCDRMGDACESLLLLGRSYPA